MKILFSRITFTVFLVMMSGIGLVFFSNLSFPDARLNFLGESKRAELTSGAALTQVILIEQDRLKGFQIFMGDTDLAFGERLDFTLLDPTCHKVLARSRRTFFSWPVIRAIHFTFNPIRESAGQAYCLSIEYRDGLMKRKERPYIRVTENEDFQVSVYTDNSKNKTYIGRTLQVRPLYTAATFSERIGELENRLSQYKPAFMKGSMLILGSGGVLVGLVFLWVLGATIAKEKD